MQKLSKIKIITTVLMTFIALIYVAPNFNIHLFSWTPENKVNLGLDLKGGSHLLLNVDFDDYIKDITSSAAESVKKHLRDEKVGYKNFQIKPNQISFLVREDVQKAQLQKLIYKADPDLSYEINDNLVTVSYSEYALNQLQDKVIEQSIEIVRMRVDSTGTKEPTIQRHGSLNILLQVPGEDNPSELKRVLGTTAKLSFHKVEQNGINDESSTREKLSKKLLPMIEGDGALWVNSKPIITGENLINARIQFQSGAPVVQFSLNQIGAKKFAEFTQKNRGARLAIILDGKILSAPSINEPINSGEGFISGNFSVDSATELALMLKAGALPAPLKIIEERVIGPNLGADSIESGKLAAYIGFILVVSFMILTYGMLGIFASVSLVIGLIYIFALLTMLQATLTLPGIAGIILTIGMAVDANVLIYERIREEISKGKSNLYSVKIGFESAFRTILDSNITTLIAAFLLYNFGVGAIKGFAVTLTIGIIASMYSAVVITRIMIDLWLKYLKPKIILY
jgi:preprotein translocase subunit SecD